MAIVPSSLSLAITSADPPGLASETVVPTELVTVIAAVTCGAPEQESP